jgi:hypothetical protein
MSDLEIPTKQREFLCEHCEGKIAVPHDLPPTTGPCPYCSETITSPGADVPSPSVANPELHLTVEGITESPPPVEIHAPAPAVVATELAEKPELNRPKSPESKQSENQAASQVPKERRRGPVSWMLGLLLLTLLGAGIAFFVQKKLGQNVDPPRSISVGNDVAIKEADYIRGGWQKDAYRLLHGYLAAKSTAEKLPFILRGGDLGKKIEDFYSGGTINDLNTPADSFSINELTEEDRKRGLFMMIYDQPPANPEGPDRLEKGNPLPNKLASVGASSTEPLRVHAFFKRTPEGLKLDWEIFAQSKYRTLRKFVERPATGQTGVFRVLMVEDGADDSPSVAGTKAYRIVDPAHSTDVARINVKVDSDAGHALSLVQWSGGGGDRPITRTATLELRWSAESSAPELEISRLVCWEFLGLGGHETPATTSTK